jgi:hypothetical protein
MNAAVALAADINAGVQLLFTIVLSKMRTTMQLTWNKVMESEGAFALAEWANTVFRAHLQ